MDLCYTILVVRSKWQVNILKNKVTLRFKLTLVFGLGIAIFANSFNLLLFYNNKNAIERDTITSIQSNAFYSAKNFELLIDNLQNFSYMVASNPGIITELGQIESGSYNNNLDGINKIEKMLSLMLFAQKNIVSVYIQDIKGNTYSVHKNFLYTNYYIDVAGKQLLEYKNMGSETKLYYFKNEKEKISDTLTFMRTIKNPDDGQIIGYVKVDTDYKLIDDLLTGVFRTENDFYLVTQNDVGFISSDNGADIELNAEPLGKIKYKNQDFIQSVNMLEYPDLKLIYVISLKEQSNRIRNLVWVNGIILLFIFVFSFLFSFITAKVMTKNIRVLREAMFRVAEGELDVNVNIKSDDEFKILGNSFNNMVMCLKGLYDRIFKLEIETKEASYRALQAQINPHFFFNTMECINYFAQSSENDKIVDTVKALTKNFRYALEGNKTVTLYDEIEHTRAYLKIISMRYADKITLDIDIDDTLYGMELPKLCIQPIVENSVLHGILKKRNAGNINITAKNEANKAVISIFDDGIGISEEKLCEINKRLNQDNNELKTHIGLINTANRIKLFFPRSDFIIESQENEYTAVKIVIRKKYE